MILNKCNKLIFFTLFMPLWLNAQGWQNTQPLNTPRVGASAVVWNQHIYLFGGKTNGNTVLNTVEKYNPANGIWDTLAVPPFIDARFNASAIVFRNKIFLIGGRDNSEVFRKIEIYDPVQNSWSIAQELRRKREGHTAVIFNDTLIVLGGIENQYQYDDEIEWYDEGEDKWESKDSSLVEGRASAYISTYQDKLYVCGGTFFGLKENSYVADTRFTWNNGPSMQTGRSYGGMVEVNDFLYMIGGETLTGVSSLVEVYNPYTWNIEPGVNLPFPRSGIAAVAINDTMYAMGGWSMNHNQILNTVEYLVLPPTGVADPIPASVPANFALLRGFPNPFNGTIQFQIEIAQQANYDLKIYDVQGRLIQNIFNGRLTPGTHKFRWDASTDTGIPVATGIYFAILKNHQQYQKLKVVYVK